MSKPMTPQRFFAASNSARGFQNYFDEIFSPRFVDHLYIIKGGPGTGKSYFMKQIARRAVVAGYAVTEYACSSDPDSLDGLILRRPGAPTIGFMDGTAPHTAEAVWPGVREELIDLGVFWDASVLLRDRDTITRLSAEKAAAYADAYAHLRAAGEMVAIADRLLDAAVRPDRLAALTARLCRGLPQVPAKPAENRKITANATVAKPRKTGDLPLVGNDQTDIKTADLTVDARQTVLVSSTGTDRPSIALRRAIGMTGAVTLPTYECMADTAVLLGDGNTPADRLTAARVLGRLWDAHSGHSGGFLVSRDPISPDKVDGLLFPSPSGGTSGLPGTTAVLIGGTLAISEDAWTAAGKQVRTVSLRRCLDTETLRAIRPDLRRVDGLRERHEAEAVTALWRARGAHFGLERIYTAAMDIPAKEAFCERFCERLFASP